MDGSVLIDRWWQHVLPWKQLAPPGEYDWTRASFAHSSPQPKCQISRFSRVCTDDCRVSLYFTMVCLFPTQNCPFPMLVCRRHVIRGSLGPPESGAQMATWSLQPFFHDSLAWDCIWQSDRQTDRPGYSVRCGVIMRNFVGYGKATQSFHVSTNNFATI